MASEEAIHAERTSYALQAAGVYFACSVPARHTYAYAAPPLVAALKSRAVGVAAVAVAAVAGVKTKVPPLSMVLAKVIVITPAAVDWTDATFFVTIGGVALIASQSVWVVVPQIIERGPWLVNASETEVLSPLASESPSVTRARIV